MALYAGKPVEAPAPVAAVPSGGAAESWPTLKVTLDPPRDRRCFYRGETIPIRIETTTTNDNRSYHVSSRKIAERLGYRPQHTIEDAVRDLCCAFKADKFTDSLTNEEYMNVKTVRKLELR